MLLLFVKNNCFRLHFLFNLSDPVLDQENVGEVMKDGGRCASLVLGIIDTMSDICM